MESQLQLNSSCRRSKNPLKISKTNARTTKIKTLMSFFCYLLNILSSFRSLHFFLARSPSPCMTTVFLYVCVYWCLCVSLFDSCVSLFDMVVSIGLCLSVSICSVCSFLGEFLTNLPLHAQYTSHILLRGMKL